jgi:hypothetical protein
MEVKSANFTMWTSLGTIRGVWFVLGITTDKEQIRDLILDEVISAMFSNSILMAEHHFATIIFTVVVTEFLNFATLEAATFTRVKV